MITIVQRPKKIAEGEPSNYVIVRPAPKLEPNLRSSYVFSKSDRSVDSGQEKEFAGSLSAIK